MKCSVLDVFFELYGHPLYLRLPAHYFPTRLTSDLGAPFTWAPGAGAPGAGALGAGDLALQLGEVEPVAAARLAHQGEEHGLVELRIVAHRLAVVRSEEHTSELQ